MRRRGKYLIVDLDDARAWVMHRRMSGNVLYRVPADPPDDYVRATFGLDDGHELRWTDLRKFGTFWLVEDATMVMEDLGPEPLDAEFTAEVLRERAGKRSAPIKAVILDQTVLAGMGNLYTDEALHYAKIDPLRPAKRLKRDDWAAPPRRHRARPADGHRCPRKQPRQHPARPHQRRWCPRPEPGVCAGLRPRGRALLRLRHADAPHQGRRPQQCLLPEVPASAAHAAYRIEPNTSAATHVAIKARKAPPACEAGAAVARPRTEQLNN